ncbi:MAG: hypothetical protein ACRDNW_12075 [Trebonia sp.]
MPRAEIVADRIAALREALDGLDARDGGSLPDDLREELMRVAVISFAAAWQDRRAAPLADPSAITATEAVIAASGLIRALNIELFELAMWQTQVG